MINGEQNQYSAILSEIETAAKDSENALIKLLKESKIAREICDFEDGPKGCPKFKINDFQKHKIKKILETEESQAQIKAIEENPMLLLEGNELYEKFLEEEEQEELKQAKARRLEYFTNNKNDLIKLPLPNGVFNGTNSKKLKPCKKTQKLEKILGDLDKLQEIKDALYEEVEEQYETFMNEAFAAIILPYFTYTMSHYCVFTKDPQNKDQILLTNRPHFISNYEYFGDFLNQLNGKALEANDEGVKPLTFKNEMMDLLDYYTIQCFEQNLMYVLNERFEITIDEDEEEFFKLVDNIMWNDDDIDVLSHFYFEIVEPISMEEVFKLYNIADQEDAYNFCLHDEKATTDEKAKIETFLQGFMTGTDKRITIFDGEIYYQAIVTKDNKITNIQGEDVKQTIIDLIWELATDFIISSSIIVQEITNIKSDLGVQQKKICGLIINQGDFINLPKEQVRDAYRDENGNMLVDKDCSFFNWYHAEPPENMIQGEQE